LFIIFIIIQASALAYFVEALRNIGKRAKEYPLKESKRTLPFGIIKLRHAVFSFILAYLGWVIFSTWLYSSFIDPTLFSFWGAANEAGIINETLLNL